LPAFGIWVGTVLYTFSHSDGHGSYTAAQTNTTPLVTRGWMECLFDASTAIFGTTNSDSWPVMIANIGQGPSRECAQLRLSTTTWSGDRMVYTPPVVGGNFTHMCFDEESARLFVAGADADGELCAWVFTLVT
jgi:hypothetical protein